MDIFLIKIKTLLFLFAIMFLGVCNSNSQSLKANTMKPFKITIQENQIIDLKNRIDNNRWFQESKTTGWGNDLSVDQMKEFTDYWATKYDWKEQETYLNSFQQYIVEVESSDIHFIHETGTGNRYIPVLFLHGWGENYTKFLKVAELLKEENPEIDVIIPSLPGFGFSKALQTDMNASHISPILNRLMTEVLGYKKYYIHGGDFGAVVAERMALDHPNNVKGIHLTDIPFHHLFGANENLTETENTFLENANYSSMQNGAYAMLQSTKPKTVAMSLNNSPVGLSYWIFQLFNDFSDPEKVFTEKYDLDGLYTNISLYWFTQTIYSSIRMYSENNQGFGEVVAQQTDTPVGFCFYPFDFSGIPPKEFADRFFSNIVHWTEQTSGGHFGTSENPSVIQLDLMRFIASIENNVGR